MKVLSKFKIICFVIAMLFLPVGIFLNANAKETVANAGFTVSPMQQKVILNPGDKYSASLQVINPGTNGNDISYTVEVRPFYVDDTYETIYENINNYGELSKWITVDSPTSGTLSPNEKAVIQYTIDVPKDAAGGGQYAAITVSSTAVKNEENIENQEDQA